MADGNIIKIFGVLNKLAKAKILDKWAIGGSIGAMFYTEPFHTADLDVFVLYKKKGIVHFSEIYDALRGMGYNKFVQQAVIIENFPVDFIATGDKLSQEAVEKAKMFKVKRYAVKTILPEYLIAMALVAFRSKDFNKIDKLLEHGKINKRKLTALLEKFDLSDKWRNYEKRRIL